MKKLILYKIYQIGAFEKYNYQKLVNESGADIIVLYDIACGIDWQDAFNLVGNRKNKLWFFNRETYTGKNWKKIFTDYWYDAEIPYLLF